MAQQQDALSGHEHIHGLGCGHTAIEHGEHLDYLHDGHLHTVHEGHIDECNIGVSAKNPDTCTPLHACGGHDAGHAHGPGCGHEAVPHATHTDYLVRGHLHHPHDGHCDDHGRLQIA